MFGKKPVAYWTVVEAIDAQGQVCEGMWRVPLYDCPTDLQAKMSQFSLMTSSTQMELCLRILPFQHQDSDAFDLEAALDSFYTHATHHMPFIGAAEQSAQAGFNSHGELTSEKALE